MGDEGKAKGVRVSSEGMFHQLYQYTHRARSSGCVLYILYLRQFKESETESSNTFRA